MALALAGKLPTFLPLTRPGKEKASNWNISLVGYIPVHLKMRNFKAFAPHKFLDWKSTIVLRCSFELGYYILSLLASQ